MLHIIIRDPGAPDTLHHLNKTIFINLEFHVSDFGGDDGA